MASNNNNVNSLSNDLSRMSVNDQQGRSNGNNNGAYVPPHMRGDANNNVPVVNFTSHSRSGGRNNRGNQGGMYNDQNSGGQNSSYGGGRFNNNNSRPQGQGGLYSNNSNNNNNSNFNQGANPGAFSNDQSNGRFGNNSSNYGNNNSYYNKNNSNYSGRGKIFDNQNNQQNNNNHDVPCNHQVILRTNPPGCGIWDLKEGHKPSQRSTAVERQLFNSEHVATGINFDRYDDIPVDATGDDVPPPITEFQQADLHPLLMSNVELATFTVPTPVQKFSIPIVAKSRDLMACAQTGSGKTAGFLFPILDDLFKNGPMYDKNPCPPMGNVPYSHRPSAFPCAIIMSPTRELCQQIFEEAKRFSYRSWVRPIAVYGGASLQNQMYELRDGCNLLVATPGRLIDFIHRRAISLSHVRYLILDEADRMLDMGFEPQIREIVGHPNMPDRSNRTTLMFSATFPRAIQYLASEFLSSDYIFLSVGRVGAASGNVLQTVLQVNGADKRGYLLDILKGEPENSKTLIFVETKRGADQLCYFLNEHGCSAFAIHGDREQCQREYALDQFRRGNVSVLVATAVASRGLDIPNVTHVINFDLPTDIDDYVHRIGRTGRAGNMGKSTAFFDRERNFGIAEALTGILNEAAQEVPDFLLSLSNRSHFDRNSGGGSGRRGGRQSGNRDFRKDSDYASFSGSSSGQRRPMDSMGGSSFGYGRSFGGSGMPPTRRFGEW